MTKQKTIVYKISDNTKEKMINYYKDKKRSKTPPYAIFQAEEADTVITLYESGKVVFQGISADIDANLWKDFESHLNNGKEIKDLTKEKKEINKKENKDYYFINSIGSDEVGTGDYFGPIVVTSAYVSKNDIPFLEDLGVRDSKNLTDDQIIKITPNIIKKIPYTTIVLNNKDYNNNYSKEINMNKIKAILHNKVLYNLLQKDKYKYDLIIVDQFVNKYKYYQYLKNLSKIIRNITFLTKAENKCLSVACASIISRFIFLKEMKKLSQELNINLPKGAGSKIDEIGKEIINKFGENKLKDIAKLNFKNTDKIKNNDK
jgi:ribonuclease HIII